MMKKTSLLLSAAIALSLTQVYAGVVLKNEGQKVGYAIGVDMGSSIAQLGISDGEELDFNAVILGLRDAYQKKDLLLTQDEMTKTLQDFSEKRLQAMKKEMEKIAAEEAEKGKAFLEENAKKDGVITTESGLQYKVVKKGTGAKPNSDDRVTVDYTGTLIDGTEFDSSKGREPITINVQDVIAGWVEGLQLMTEGANYIFYIPSDLAYGSRGAGNAIPPNATLIFDVNLLKIEKNEAEAEADKKESIAKSINKSLEEATEIVKAEVEADKKESIAKSINKSLEEATETVKAEAEADKKEAIANSINKSLEEAAEAVKEVIEAKPDEAAKK
ncbi:FKBP-type peptidyl-prolyl cis-trans isomerase [Dichelobacter nodosus]|uniref:peptidylprolyl isomerase n=1 Tax=Dichelobacter nodosus (strain VCS1703A) TaxID=246195 RepID=A5EX06_DICNV|nr:FKBP-type peptidyl-prolyl cis-trans isomerase [Dichelobacter nodosus]ABQ13710.1 peptidyl-prolyl cis-trans isomerase, FKBP-type [Dichelobacter nodosus VCS1703A]